MSFEIGEHVRVIDSEKFLLSQIRGKGATIVVVHPGKYEILMDDKTLCPNTPNKLWYVAGNSLELIGDFKVGDKVRFLAEALNLKGATGVVTGFTTDGHPQWVPDNPKHYRADPPNHYWSSSSNQLEIIEEAKPEPQRTENRGLDLLMGTANDGVVGGWDYLRR